MASLLQNLFTSVKSFVPSFVGSSPAEVANQDEAAGPSPPPIMLIGPSSKLCQRVSVYMLPRYKVTHNLTSLTQAKRDLLAIQEARNENGEPENEGSDKLPLHVIFAKGFQKQRVLKLRESLGGETSGFCWYWTPMREDEKPPNPESLTDEQADHFAGVIATHISNSIDEVVARGGEGDGELHDL